MKYIDISIYTFIVILSSIVSIILIMIFVALLNKLIRGKKNKSYKNLKTAFKKYHENIVKDEMYEEAIISTKVLQSIESNNFKILREHYYITKEVSFKFKKEELKLVRKFIFELKDENK